MTIYFLFVNLLGYKNLGQFEKIAWSIPIDYKGKAYLIEHRKFGVCLLANNPSKEQKEIKEILENINDAIIVAQPYFKYIAKKSIQTDKINIKNNNANLYKRFQYFYEQYLNHKKKIKLKMQSLPKHEKLLCSIYPSSDIREMEYLLFAMLEAFYSWSEHIFVLLAILYGKFNTGDDIAKFQNKHWNEKYKEVIGVKEDKELYENLILIRQQLRNFNSHGALGKNGETFSFHSGAGAVPVFLNDKNLTIALTQHDIEYLDKIVIPIINRFNKMLWKGKRRNAKLLIQDYSLDLVLNYSTNKQYTKLLNSRKAMKDFIDYTIYQIDRATNMDF